MNFVSYRTLMRDTERLCYNNPQWRNLSGVVGIPKSGLIPASIIAMRFNLPMADLHSFLDNAGRFYPSREGSKPRLDCQRVSKPTVLLVDDSVWSGNTLRHAINEIHSHPILYSIGIDAVTLYGNPDSSDFQSLVKLDSPRIFEWNWARNAYLQETMTDLDGILCYDPNPTMTRDPEYYAEWVKDPVPKHLPQITLRAIVSARLEKYRSETEAWLNRQGIKYQELSLLDCTEAERHEKGLHAEHKVAMYSNSLSRLFIESDILQSQYINRRVQKPVFCPASDGRECVFFN